MRVDSVRQQLDAAARRAGLGVLFGELSFDADGVAALEAIEEGDAAEVGFCNADGPVGLLLVDAYDSGNPEDGGLTVGLRGWRLHEDVASV